MSITTIANLQNTIFDIREKLSDSDYINIMHLVSKINEEADALRSQVKWVSVRVKQATIDKYKTYAELTCSNCNSKFLSASAITSKCDLCDLNLS